MSQLQGSPQRTSGLPTPGSPAQVPVMGREVSTTSAMRTGAERATGVPALLLRGPRGLTAWGSSARDAARRAPGTRGEGLRSLLQGEGWGLAEAIGPLSIPPPNPTWGPYHRLPWPCDSLRPPPLPTCGPPSRLQWLFHTDGLLASWCGLS